MKTHQSNTYDLIVDSESEDRNRTVVEALIYAVFIGSAIVSIFQCAVQPVVTPDRIAAKHIAISLPARA